MLRPSRPFPFVAAMLCACAALLAALAWLWLGAGARAWQPPPAQPPQFDGLLAAAPPLEAPARAAPAVLLERPPFHSSRRPPPVAAAPSQAKSAVALDKVRFYGIVTGPALTTVMAEVEEQPRALRVGDRIGEWELAAVKGRSITFSKGGERHVIELPYVHTAPASPAGAADAPPLPAGMPARPPQGRPAQGMPPPSSFRPQF